MRHRSIRGAVLAAVVAVGWPAAVRAQEGGFQVPLNTDPTIPIPTGKAGDPGFYGSAEYVMLHQTRALGHQDIAYRGFIDATGGITGLPGTFVGSGQVALRTQQMGKLEWQPGFQVEVGYKLDTGTQIYAKYLQLFDAHYTSGATLVPRGFKGSPTLSDTFLSAPVYNFPPAFAGAQIDTSFDNAANGGFNTYGIWNAADVMDTKFLQRFQQAEMGLRVPMFATEYSRIYSMAGGRFAWFFERYTWRTVDLATDGSGPPQNAADYSNTLSQRMYGAFVGCGHEVYLGDWFSCSFDVTAAGFMALQKERAKYELGDKSTESKWGRETFSFVPSVTAQANLWWYPIEGVQVRLGYSGMSFFNTQYMVEPVGYNFGNIEPRYGTKWFRLLHGFNFGVGIFF